MKLLNKKTLAPLLAARPVLNPLTSFLYEKVIKFKNHRHAHRSGHQKIIEALEHKVKIEKNVASPKFLPLNYTLYFMVKAKKSAT